VKAILFELKDPVGRIVKLFRETWEKHIILRHPEMQYYYTNIQTTIIEPNVIIESPTNLSLIYANNDVTSSKLYVNVVVGFSDSSYIEGIVRTSLLTTTLLDGKPIWIRKKY